MRSIPLIYAHCADSDDEALPEDLELNPSQIQDRFALGFNTGEIGESVYILGKWMVFRYLHELDETWKKICKALIRGKLQDCLTVATTTQKYEPREAGPGPNTTGVIFVYTEEHNVDAIGFELVKIVKNDIKYKTEQASENREYVHCGHGRVTTKTIFWNDGRPSFTCEDKPCHATPFNRMEDTWRVKCRDSA